MNELLSYMSENSLLIICVCILIIIVIVVLIARRSATQKKSTNPIKSRKNLTLDDCVSRDDIQFKIDTYQRNLEQELSRSKKKINEAKRKGYIKSNTTWTERFDKFTEISNTLYKNLEYENARKLNTDKFHRYANLHFRSMILGNLAYNDYRDSQKVRDEISHLLVDIGKKKVTVTKSEKAELYDIKDICVKTTKYLYDRMVVIQKETGTLRDKIRDECGSRGREWFAKLENNKRKNRK